MLVVIKFILQIAIAAGLLTLAAANMQVVTVSFWGIKSLQQPLIVIIMGTLLAGMFLGMVFSLKKIITLKRELNIINPKNIIHQNIKHNAIQEAPTNQSSTESAYFN